MLERHIGDYNFVADSRTGVTLRWGKSYSEDPNWAPVPELADISISNHCTKGCSFCYRDSAPNNDFMSLEDYCKVLDALNHPEYGNVFQVALGGGEPLEHPQFRQIIDTTVFRSIVPNFTTNGIHLNEDICGFVQGKVGAVALSVSSISELQSAKISLLNRFRIKTNVHYVLSNNNIGEACKILRGKYNTLLESINALVFLTYKPAGRAFAGDVIKDNNEFRDFISLVDNEDLKRLRIGFDACFVPMLLRYTTIKKELIDTCEGAFFSVYIDHKKNVSPCSFSGKKDSYSLEEFSFYDIWNDKFEEYRKRVSMNCNVDCKIKMECRGVCPYYPVISLCHG